MGWFIAGFAALRLFGIAFLALLVARIVAGARDRHDAGVETIRRRFASGEITEEEFRRRQEVLDS
jgi:uncharacterized membrane protein